jgi:hypothetical protein
VVAVIRQTAVATLIGMSALALGLSMAIAQVNAMPLVVIAHVGVQVTAGEVVDVFLGDKHFADGVKLTPVDNSPLQERFIGAVLNLDVVRYNSRWAKKSFREGFNPPALKFGDAEVAEYVRRTPGAIGYVTTAPVGVTVFGRY